MTQPATAPAGRPRYAYLGPPGTFTEAALRQVADPATAAFQPEVDVICALDTVREGRADFAVVPIENSVEGGVNATLDALATGRRLVVVAEMIVPVSFVLAARPGTTLADVRRIGTHPHAWAQCRRWIAAHLPGSVHVPATSTAAAAELLAREGSPGFEAALVAPLSSALYGLDELATDVEDNASAVTRFVLVRLPGDLPARTGADKTTLVVHLADDHPGALLEMLEQFATRGVNLSRIESRPIGDSLGRYSFSLDAEGHISDERVAAALMGLHRVCPVVRFLGSYPRVDAVRSNVRPGTSDEDFLAARAWVQDLREGRAPSAD